MTRPPATSQQPVTINMVVPPYTAIEPCVPAPPLGSLYLLEVDDADDGSEVMGWLKEAPWVPLVLVQRSPYVPPGLLSSLQGLCGAPAFVWRRADDGLPLHLLAQDAVRGRAVPDADQVAAWIAARLGRADVLQSLAVAMGSRPQRGILARLLPSGRWLARRLRSVSPLTTADWRDVFHLSTAAGNTRLTTAQAALRLECDIWTLRRRLERLAGVTADEYRTLAGWEWFLEAVLRKWGVVRVSREVSRES